MMYFITCFSKCGTDKNGWLDMGESRTFGYKESFKDAEEALNENHCDMFECLYRYAVVEKIPAGIHPRAKERYFFKYSDEKKGFYRIDEPKEFKDYSNIALG